MLRLQLLASALLSTQLLWAQTDSSQYQYKRNPMNIEFEFEEGGILGSREYKNTAFQDASYEGINLKIGWRQVKSKDPYNQLYNYPVYGVGIYSGNFNNNIIGRPLAFYGYVQIPVLPNLNSRWSYDYRIGLGLACNFKPYNKTSNPSNYVIGSNNNVYIDLGVKISYQLSNTLRAGAGVAFHHFSNGSTTLPNKGINLVPVTVSIAYAPRTIRPMADTSVKLLHSKKWSYDLNFGLGLKQITEDDDRRYKKMTFGFYVSRQLSYKWRLGGGFDLFYSSTGRFTQFAGEDAGKMGAMLSGGPSLYIVHMLNSRLYLNGNIGYYLHRQEYNGEVSKIYLRTGVRYYVYKNFNTGISIKAHKGKADFIEWSVGYSFKR